MTQKKEKLINVIISILLSITFVILLNQYNIYAEKDKPKKKKLNLLKVENLQTGYGVKAVELSADGSRVYSMNLEGCSVYEFNRKTRVIQRKVEFITHPGKGFNYTDKVWINSLQEKPVEGHFSHNGRYLWVSLHNADGIVAWDLLNNDTYVKGRPFKEAWYYERFEKKKDAEPVEDTASKKVKKKKRRVKEESPYSKKKIRLLWIKTGSTPKVISSSPDGRYLFVANWHSSSVSVLQIDSGNPADWKIIKTLRTGSIPRGMVASPDSKYLFIAQMGSNYISVVDLSTLEKIKEIKVGVNPRHITISNGYLYTSLNITSKLLKIDLNKWNIVKSMGTLASPRTISISADGKVVFVVCYGAQQMQAYTADDFTLLGGWGSAVSPVAVTVYQDENVYEAWVGNHTSGTIKIFTFSRNFD